MPKRFSESIEGFYNTPWTEGQEEAGSLAIHVYKPDLSRLGLEVSGAERMFHYNNWVILPRTTDIADLQDPDLLEQYATRIREDLERFQGCRYYLTLYNEHEEEAGGFEFLELVPHSGRHKTSLPSTWELVQEIMGLESEPYAESEA